MKKLLNLICIILFSININAQVVNYTEDQTNILNPERGYYFYTTGKSTGTFNPLTTSQLNTYKNTNKVSLVWRCYYLDKFRTTAISSAFLNKIQTDFNTVRNSNTGIKLIVRFAYSNDNKDATKAQILSHIDQLIPIMTSNQDIISSLEAGFIGAYGEWYDSLNFGKDNLTTTQLNNRKEVANKIMLMCPNRKVAFRTPEIIRKNNIPDNKNVGFHNDCFLADSSDYGTFYTTADYNLINTLSLNSVTGGEVCNLSSYSSCSNSITKMTQMHWNYLNLTYNNTVFNSWKTNNCYNEITNRLGYRFVLLNSSINNNILTLNLKNIGFGNLFNNHTAYLVFENITTNIKTKIQLNSDPKTWLAGQNTIITQSLNSGLVNGSYKLYLSITDNSLPNNIYYNIKTANIGLYNGITGLNDLQQLVIISNNVGRGINDENNKIRIFDLYGQEINKTFSELDMKRMYILKIYHTETDIETVKIYKY